MPRKLVNSLKSSRVDYCNSIFYGATDVVVRRLQSVLNAAARLISNRRKFDHITPVLRDQLHWLPIRQRIDFKIAVCLQRPSCLRFDPQLHLQSCPRGRRQSSPAIWYSRRPDCFEPGLVSLGPEASVSRDRSFGTHCPSTF